MKIKKILLILILSILWHSVLFAQSVVKDTSNVKRPIVGKLYYQKTDNNLYLYRNGFELVDLYQENIIVPPDTSIVEPPKPIDPEKISIPVGLIMWDNWEHDYWNETKDMDKLLINHISRNRYTATVFGDRFNLVPFYGQHTAPEKIMIRYNVKWNQSLGRNTYDSLERFVTVKFDKNQSDIEREVKYYRDAGFDFLVFNYYSDESYLSETRRDFVAIQNKLGMKMTFKIQNKRSDKEVDYIADLMTKDYWFNIDNKPVLYLNSGDFGDLQRYKNALKAKNGKDIYVVYYDFNGYPGDWNDFLQKGNNAVSAYNTTIGGISTAEQQLQKEVSDRENWMGQFKPTHVNIIPVLSLGLENLDQRTELTEPGKQVGIIYKANFEQINRKNILVKEFIKKYPDKVPALIWNSGNEIMETGESLVPKKLKNGTIDTSILDAVSKHLN